MNDTQTLLVNLGLMLLGCCIVPLIGMLLAGWWILRRSLRSTKAWFQPDEAQIQQNFARLQRKYPNESRELLVRRIIRQQALRCGVIGALTSTVGLPLMPLMLPLDVYTSSRIQATMVYFIAAAYGKTGLSATEKRAIDYMVFTGAASVMKETGQAMSQVGQKMALQMGEKMALRLGEKAFAKIIPLLGAALGFGINYGAAWTTGRLAQSWYHNQPKLGTMLGQGTLQPQLGAGAAAPSIIEAEATAVRKNGG